MFTSRMRTISSSNAAFSSKKSMQDADTGLIRSSSEYK